MQKKKSVIACISLLAGSAMALSGTMAQATSAPYAAAATGTAGASAAVAADALYVAPGGTDSAAGTRTNPTTLSSAINRITAGGTIYLRGGTYNYSQTVAIPPGKNGLSGNRTEIFAYAGRDAGAELLGAERGLGQPRPRDRRRLVAPARLRRRACWRQRNPRSAATTTSSSAW